MRTATRGLRAGAVLLAALLLAVLAAPPARAAGLPRERCSGAHIASAGWGWGTSELRWTHTGGPTANVMVSVAPTRRGRVLGPAAPAGELWRELTACVALPPALAAGQGRSLRMQLLCHAVWSGGALRAGGDTWELEAWRPPVPRAEVLSARQVTDPGRRCNWGPDTGPAYAPPTPEAAVAAALAEVARRVLAVGLRAPAGGPAGRAGTTG